MTTKETPFTTPQVSAKGTDWFVWFRFFHGGKWHLRKYREDLNRIKNKKEKAKYAEALAEARHEWLKSGWNPIADPEFKARNVTKENEIKRMTFKEAMDFALEKKRPDLAKKSYQDYKNILCITKNMAEITGIAFLQASMINRIHVLTLLEEMSKARKWSNHRHNMYLGCIRSMFTVLVKWLAIEHNPATLIEEKQITESNKYASFTEDEKKKISDHLLKTHEKFFNFVQVIYQTGIRPKELLALKVEAVDLKRRVITIIPNFDEENSKTKFIRPVPIPDVLIPILKSLRLEQYPKNFFVFGSPFEPGKGNRGTGSMRYTKAQRLGLTFQPPCGKQGAMRDDYFIPSPYKGSRDTVTRLWKRLIKDEGTGLGIHKCLYAAKHTGADDKILAGIELDSLRNMYGHRSKYMTEIYAKQVTELYNSEIMSKSPAFTRAKVRKIA